MKFNSRGMIRMRMPAIRATSGVICSAVMTMGFPIGFAVREDVRARRDQFGGTRVLDLNAPTAVRFYATNATDSSRSGMTVHISARLPLPRAGRGWGEGASPLGAESRRCLYRYRLNRGAQNRGEAPSPSFAPLTRPLPARRGEVVIPQSWKNPPPRASRREFR